jgi:MGT family glycosyltransferase
VTPRRFLFVLWEGGGNCPPQLAIAGRLSARGHAVTVLADPSIEADAIAAGASFVPWRQAPHRTTRTPESEIIRDWAARTALGAFARARDRHAFRPAKLFAREVLSACAERGIDRVVVDAMLFGGLVGAEASGRPWAALIPMTSFLPAPGRPPAALGLLPARGVLGRARDAGLAALGNRLLWRSCLAPLNEARAEAGLPAVAHPLDQIRRASRVLVLTSPAFDFGAPPLRDNVQYTGPELADPAWAEGQPPPSGRGPLVLVGLSTTYQGHEGLLRCIVEALAQLPVRAVVTLGPALDPAHFASPAPSITLVPRASHAALLPQARLVVTHGGHGTVIRSLAAGVPVLVLPLGRDQADNAARAASCGAGTTLRPGASSRRLRETIARALTDEALLGGARALARTMASELRGDPAVEALEGLR